MFSRTHFAFLVIIGAAVLGASSWLRAAGPGGCHACPDCGCKVCEPVPTTLKEKKTAWNVECKDICVPGVKWPWEPCCAPPKCGYVKTVRVLKKIEYECDKCGYKWEVKTVCQQCCQ